MKTGVIIGRFQTDKLTEGHKFLISSVLKLCDRVIVILGESVTKVNRKHQLPASIRQRMIRETYPQVIVASVNDCYENEEWSRKVDKVIDTVTEAGELITLYHSRDGFGDTYKGMFPVVSLKTPLSESATERREMIANGFFNADASFRRGIIWASYNRWPITFPCVDIGIVRRYVDKVKNVYNLEGTWIKTEDVIKYEILIGRKEGESQWRLPGGFVDVTDESLEAAAGREMREEVGHIDHHGFKYVCSQKINDWRYEGTGDGIITTLFTCVMMAGMEKGGDDLPFIKWVPLEQAEAEVFNGHKGLIQKLINFYIK